MKKLLIMFVLILVGVSSTGCTLTETSAERKIRIRQITKLELKMLVEDWDYLWLNDHSSGTTQWNTWTGM